MSRASILRQKIKEKKIGPILGTMIVILIFFVIALYALASHLSKVSPTYFPSITNLKTIKVDPIYNKADDVQSLKEDLKRSVDVTN